MSTVNFTVQDFKTAPYINRMKEYLFSYGTLQKKEVQLDLFGRLPEGTIDVLLGYKTDIIEIKDDFFLSRGEEKYQHVLVRTNNSHDRVAGTVFELKEDEMLLADEYEPENYKRIKVKLESGKEAWIYLADYHLGY